MSTQLEEKIKHTWSNKDNVDFYKLLPIGDFKDFATRVGIANGEDVEQIRNLVLNANSILEFGGGYGRVIDKLIEINPKAHITTIERNERLANYLNNKYSGKVDVIMADFLDSQMSGNFDLIVMMWSTFGEFSKTEQLQVFKLYSEILHVGGMLVIDAAQLLKSHPYAEVVDQYLYVKTKVGYDKMYIPTLKEFHKYAETNGFVFEKHEELITSTGNKRLLYFFRRV